MTAKRLFDIFFSGAGILVLAPVYIGAAIAIRLDSPGPVLFRQTRVGQGGRPFTIFKFRTMTNEQEGSSEITVGRDARITRVGQSLRRSKIDELPQLFNVLAGDMSIVGPRPEVAMYVECYPPEIRETVLSVRPGITDTASLLFINEAEMLENVPDPYSFYVKNVLPIKTSHHVDYVKNRSFGGDVLVIVNTIFTIFRSYSRSRNTE